MLRDEKINQVKLMVKEYEAKNQRTESEEGF